MLGSPAAQSGRVENPPEGAGESRPPLQVLGHRPSVGSAPRRGGAHRPEPVPPATAAPAQSPAGSGPPGRLGSAWSAARARLLARLGPPGARRAGAARCSQPRDLQGSIVRPGGGGRGGGGGERVRVRAYECLRGCLWAGVRGPPHPRPGSGTEGSPRWLSSSRCSQQRYLARILEPDLCLKGPVACVYVSV